MGIDSDGDDVRWMRYALELAGRAAAVDEVPVGAVIVRDGEILGEGWNRPIAATIRPPTPKLSPCAHSRSLDNYRLTGTTLYVTLEPCLMCAGAMVHARIGRLVFGASDPKRGAVNSTTHAFDAQGLNHRVEVSGGVLESECARSLQAFFVQRRASVLR